MQDNKDLEAFVTGIGELSCELKSPIYAWSLLMNHAHILIRSGPKGLPTFMRRLLTGYTVRYNLRHGRHGHFFQNRYKAGSRNWLKGVVEA